jgi:hypothetical protein
VPFPHVEQFPHSTGSIEKCERFGALLHAAAGARLAMPERMTRIVLSVLLIATAGALPARAERIPHLRTTDAWLRTLIREGIETSPTFRVLVARLERSDVVVYVQCSAYGRPSAVNGGRLTFVSSAGGFRYVVVQMARLPSRAQQIAMLAHELQHAVEIADRPEIIDALSLARAYRHMADASEVRSGDRVAFDTAAAIAMGVRVLLELGGAHRTSRPTPAAAD